MRFRHENREPFHLSGETGVRQAAVSITCCLILVLVTSACAGPSYQQHVLDEIHLRAQERILHQARREFKQGNYQAVTRRLTRLLRLYPTTPLRGEALWWLARSFEEQGAWREARLQYQMLIEQSPNGRFRASANQRLAAIRDRLQRGDDHREPVQAVQLTLAAIMKEADRGEKAVGHLLPDGSNTVLIDLGCPISEHTFAQSPQRTAWSSRSLLLDHRVASWIRVARERGLRVYVGVHLRCLGAWHNAPPDDWRDRRYDPTVHALETSSFFDLFHPEYQAFLFHVLRGIVQLDLDGLVYLGDPPLGLYAGFSERARQAFARAFEISFVPLALFERERVLPVSQQQMQQLEGASRWVAPEFWRWAGWKMRERLHILRTLTQQLKRVNPALDIGVSVHLLSLQKPHVALGCLGEDALETARLPWDLVIVVMATHSHVDCRMFGAGGEPVSVSSFLDEHAIGPFFSSLGETPQVWLVFSRREPDLLPERVLTELFALRDSQGTMSPRIGIVFEQ